MSSDDSIVDRISSFVSENKRGVAIGVAAAAVAVGGVAYYVASSRARSGVGDEESLRGGKKKDKKKKKHRKIVKDKDGPILEEKKPKAAEESDDDHPLTEEQIQALDTGERKSLAASLKQKGNDAYQARKFPHAIQFYTRAIAVSPQPEPVFYSNRAACYVSMEPPQHEKVVADCDEALKLDSRYVKALNRRATALEALERYEEALRDYTATTILGKFQNDAAGRSVERVLEKLSKRKPLRSSQAVSAVSLLTHSSPPISRHSVHVRLPTLPENPSTGDNTLILALEALGASDYAHSFTLVTRPLNRVYRGNMEERKRSISVALSSWFLIGDTDGAKVDFEESVQLLPSYTQSWVKIASVHMEQVMGRKLLRPSKRRPSTTRPTLTFTITEGKYSSS
ncbi:hypothetical protein BC826DRAFT_1113408 [Russula brevipes]|nr:hypothetical protein BC826DRAFT_1113408 [Russula brevipes]